MGKKKKQQVDAVEITDFSTCTKTTRSSRPAAMQHYPFVDGPWAGGIYNDIYHDFDHCLGGAVHQPISIHGVAAPPNGATTPPQCLHGYFVSVYRLHNGELHFEKLQWQNHL